MRDPDRINTFCNSLAVIWEKYTPDWRFGQLCSNFFCWLNARGIDPFFPEEDKMIELFQSYLKEITNAKWED